MNRTLISLGSINADFQMRTDAPAGSDETLLAHDFIRPPGGKAANTAYLAASFGHRSILLGRVGDDELARQTLDPLREAGVDVAAVSKASGVATGVSIIVVPPDGKKNIVLATNANDQWDDQAIAAAIDVIAKVEGRACFVVDYEVPAHVVARAIAAAHDRGLPVVLDPSFPDRLDRSVLGQVTALTPNVSEAGALLGRKLDTLEQAAAGARELCGEGAGLVCFKLSDGGCVWANRDVCMHMPAGDVKPVDTTGAGDAFTGVLAIALLEERDTAEAVSWAVAAANLAVTGYGSQSAYAPRDRVLAMAAELRKGARRLDG